MCNFILIPFKPYPPPRGCILVYKKSLCCPYLSCSKYHINYYKNTERNGGENLNQLQVNHEKTLEKGSRLESDGEEETNGGKRRKKRKQKAIKKYKTIVSGCVESGSLYASGESSVA